MTDAWAVFTNNTALVAVPHTLFGALAVAGAFLLGIAWYHLWRRRHDGIDAVGADGKVIPGEAARSRAVTRPTTRSGSVPADRRRRGHDLLRRNRHHR